MPFTLPTTFPFLIEEESVTDEFPVGKLLRDEGRAASNRSAFLECLFTAIDEYGELKAVGNSTKWDNEYNGTGSPSARELALIMMDAKKRRYYRIKDVIVMPAATTVYCQPYEITTWLTYALSEGVAFNDMMDLGILGMRRLYQFLNVIDNSAYSNEGTIGADGPNVTADVMIQETVYDAWHYIACIRKVIN